MSAATPTELIEHIVLFKAKPDLEPSKLTAMVDHLNTLASIETVLHFTAGPIHNFRSSSLTFTHMIHSRYATRADLADFAHHPTHVAVIKETRPKVEDVMAMDWAFSTDSVTIPPGSAMRMSFLKLKENLEEKEKNEVLGVIGGMKEKFPKIQLLSFGENISPGRNKDFSIASVAVFKNKSELEGFDSEWEAARNEQKDMGKDKVEEAFVFDHFMP